MFNKLYTGQIGNEREGTRIKGSCKRLPVEAGILVGIRRRLRNIAGRAEEGEDCRHGEQPEQISRAKRWSVLLMEQLGDRYHCIKEDSM